MSKKSENRELIETHFYDTSRVPKKMSKKSENRELIETMCMLLIVRGILGLKNQKTE